MAPVSLVLVLLVFSVTATTGLRCYDCNSHWKGCGADGEIDSEHASKMSCNGMCMQYTNKWDPGTIYRGCSDYYYFPVHIESNSPSTFNGNQYVFCENDLCNTLSMEEYTTGEYQTTTK